MGDHGTSAHRIALVVGVGDYAKAPGLPNTVHDVREMARSPWESGFEVLELIDLGIYAFRAAPRVAGERLQPGAHAVFYFAGHGVQLEGENYLLPRDGVHDRTDHAACHIGEPGRI